MSLDNFQLPSILLPELYKNSLVALESNQLTTKSLKEEQAAFLGKNLQHILVLVNHENVPYLPDEDMNFLAGIIGACKLTIADIALVNMARNEPLGYQELIHQFKPTVILCFGIGLEEAGFPLSFPYYQLQQYNKQTYLAAPPLATLATDVAEKRQLWACLKTLFSV